MKIISINTHRGEKLEELLKFAEEEMPDIICMQEVYALDDIELNPQIGPGGRCFNFHNIFSNNKLFPYSFFAPTFRFNGSERDLAYDGYFGNATYSSKPFNSAQSYFFDILFEYEHQISRKDPSQQPRNMQLIMYEFLNKKLQVINTHGIWQLKERKDDTSRTIKMIDTLLSHIIPDIPTIIVGDFNLLPETESIKNLENAGYQNLIKTFNIKSNRNSKGYPEIIDYIFVSKDIIIQNFNVPNIEVSDHLPLILDFEIG
jgi:endonuclease/exonuclease/phosphatase family metal-dependent hydrolase